MVYTDVYDRKEAVSLIKSSGAFNQLHRYPNGQTEGWWM